MSKTSTLAAAARFLPLAATFAGIAASLWAPPACAQAKSNYVALGAVSVPEYEGSSDRMAVPWVTGRIDFGRDGSLQLGGGQGLGLRYNVFESNSPWAAGPLLSFRPARDSDVKNAAVARLREVDATAEAGAFVEYGLRDAFSVGDRLAFGVEAKGGKSSQMALTSSYLFPKSGDLQLAVFGRLTYANTKYMDTYFSVDADNSLRSGLPRYQAESGMKDASFGVAATYDIDRDWLVSATLGVKRLSSNAANSPVVTNDGKRNTAFIGAAVGYRF